jgi:hypothetical protein
MMYFSIVFQLKSLRKEVNALSSGVIEKVASKDVVIEKVEDAANLEMANQPECDNLNRDENVKSKVNEVYN